MQLVRVRLQGIRVGPEPSVPSLYGKRPLEETPGRVPRPQAATKD